MDPNNSSATPPSSDVQQQDTTQVVADQPAEPQISADPATQPQPAPADPTTAQVQQPVTQAQPVDAAEPQTTYVEDVGESMVDLLDDIDANENFVQIVAKEMELDATKVKSILTGLLEKIDQGQITVEELALITASTVVDDPTETA